MSKRFTIQEARRLLPEVEQRLQLAIEAREQLRSAEGELEALQQKAQWSGGLHVDPASMLGLGARRRQHAAELRDAVRSIHDLGVLLKDLEAGLVDFPTSYRGEEVLLCWKLGEADITFWHGLEAGFQGRRPIDKDFLSNHGGAVD